MHAWFSFYHQSFVHLAGVCLVSYVRTSVCVCVCTCVTGGVMWHNMDSIYDWFNKFYSFYMAAMSLSVVGVAIQ